MNVLELSKAADLKVITIPFPEHMVNGAYIGDLLSWVMGRATEGNAWVTIMSNPNIVAVASLAEVSCIILAEGVAPDEGVAKTAEVKGVNILSSDKSAYEIAKKLSELNI